jgi:NADPH:quinone reductase-like Zn-dependent oxidoreductase
MKAAVVHSFDKAPSYEDVPDPVASGNDQMVVDVLAAGLHPLVRSQADGSHYTSTGQLPLVPGIDAVVRDPDGNLRYALVHESSLGTMAERTIVETYRSVVLPDAIDPVVIAAAMNPAMASWVALRKRISFERDARVLILGATGNAGRMAIQIAKHFGAKEVIAAGRATSRFDGLRALGADQTCTFDEVAVAADVDVVIDFVWGQPTADAMVAVLTNRKDRGAAITWIEIGAIAGATAAVPAAALRSARLQIVGSGIGSVPALDYADEIPKLAGAVADGLLDVHARTVPLADVEKTWTDTAGTDDRIVFVP